MRFEYWCHPRMQYLVEVEKDATLLNWKNNHFSNILTTHNSPTTVI